MEVQRNGTPILALSGCLAQRGVLFHGQYQHGMRFDLTRKELGTQERGASDAVFNKRLTLSGLRGDAS